MTRQLFELNVVIFATTARWRNICGSRKEWSLGLYLIWLFLISVILDFTKSALSLFALGNNMTFVWHDIEARYWDLTKFKFCSLTDQSFWTAFFLLRLQLWNDVLKDPHIFILRTPVNDIDRASDSRWAKLMILDQQTFSWPTVTSICLLDSVRDLHSFLFWMHNRCLLLCINIVFELTTSYGFLNIAARTRSYILICICSSVIRESSFGYATLLWQYTDSLAAGWILWVVGSSRRFHSRWLQFLND